MWVPLSLDYTHHHHHAGGARNSKKKPSRNLIKAVIAPKHGSLRKSLEVVHTKKARLPEDETHHAFLPAHSRGGRPVNYCGKLGVVFPELSQKRAVLPRSAVDLSSQRWALGGRKQRT